MSVSRCPDHGRLGRPDISEYTTVGQIRVDTPVKLPEIPGSRIDELFASGWYAFEISVVDIG